MAENTGAPDRETLTIPSLLHEQLVEMIEGTDFGSVSEFVVHVLRDVVAAHKASAAEGYSPEEIERVKARLKSLGYL